MVSVDGEMVALGGSWPYHHLHRIYMVSHRHTFPRLSLDTVICAWRKVKAEVLGSNEIVELELRFITYCANTAHKNVIKCR